MKKSELRTKYKQKAAELSSVERTERSKKIAENLFDAFDLSAILNLHCFISIEKFNEVETAFIFRRLWAEFPAITTFAPRSDLGTGMMSNIKYAKGSQLELNVWGIWEPVGENFTAISEMDMVIVPLLCFDAAGHRVGYGKGFYDRSLSSIGADRKKIGVSYFGPDVIDDTGVFDIALDAVVTPDHVFKWD